MAFNKCGEIRALEFEPLALAKIVAHHNTDFRRVCEPAVRANLNLIPTVGHQESMAGGAAQPVAREGTAVGGERPKTGRLPEPLGIAEGIGMSWPIGQRVERIEAIGEGQQERGSGLRARR